MKPCTVCGEPSNQTALFYRLATGRHETKDFCSGYCLQMFKESHLSWSLVRSTVKLAADLRAIAKDHPLAAQRGIMEAAADELDRMYREANL